MVSDNPLDYEKLRLIPMWLLYMYAANRIPEPLEE